MNFEVFFKGGIRRYRISYRVFMPILWPRVAIENPFCPEKVKAESLPLLTAEGYPLPANSDPLYGVHWMLIYMGCVHRCNQRWVS